MVNSITVYEGKPVGIRAFLTKEDGVTALQQADVDTITAVLYEVSSDTPNTLVSTQGLVVSTVIFDTLQTGGWNKAGGYDFLWVAPGLNLVRGGGHYRWNIEIVGLSSDDNNRIIAEVHVTDLLG